MFAERSLDAVKLIEGYCGHTKRPFSMPYRPFSSIRRRFGTNAGDLLTNFNLPLEGFFTKDQKGTGSNERYVNSTSLLSFLCVSRAEIEQIAVDRAKSGNGKIEINLSSLFLPHTVVNQLVVSFLR